MIYDCFLFNSELDLLQLRLSFLNDVVDHFVIVESKRTLSGLKKPLHYKENLHLFEKYNHKIIHVEAPLMPELASWEYEYFQRNFIKTALGNCAADDIILITDLDEIVNLKHILSIPSLQLPTLIDLPYYYYFFNLKANGSFNVKPMLSKFSFLKEMPVGERNETYKRYIKNVLKKEDHPTGWHFSYLFGFDIPKYQEKIRSFSHQEFNTAYFLNPQRIIKCIQAGIDIFERKNVFFSFKNADTDLFQIMPHITQLGLEQYIYQPNTISYFKNKVLLFMFTKKFIPLLWQYLYVIPRYKIIELSSPLRKKFKYLVTKISISR